MRFALAVPWLLLVAAACTGDDRPAAPAVEATAEATQSPTATPSQVAVATPEATPLAWAAGEPILLATEVVSDVRIVELTERLEDGALDGERDSLLYDLREDRLFLVEGAEISRFIPARAGDRPVAAARTEVGLAGSTLLVWVEPLEVVALPVLMNVRPRSLEPPFRGTAEVNLPQARSIAGRVAPAGTYAFDASSMELVLVRRSGGGFPPPPEAGTTWEAGGGAAIVVERDRPPGGTRPRAALKRQGVILVDVLQAHWTSPDGARIAVVGNGSELWIVEVANGDTWRIGFAGGYGSVRWSLSSRYLAVSVSGPFDSTVRSVYVLDLDGVPVPIQHGGPPTLGPYESRSPVGWVSDTELLMFAPRADPGDARPFEVLDVEHNEITRFTIDDAQALWTLKLSPDGEWLATSTFDRSLGIWSTRDGSRLLIEQLEGVDLGILDASWSSDGRWLALSRSGGRS